MENERGKRLKERTRGNRFEMVIPKTYLISMPQANSRKFFNSEAIAECGHSCINAVSMGTWPACTMNHIQSNIYPLPQRFSEEYLATSLTHQGHYL